MSERKRSGPGVTPYVPPPDSYTRVPNYVWDRDRHPWLTDCMVATFTALCSFIYLPTRTSDRHSRCTASVEAIARRARQSERTVRRNLAVFVKQGFIYRQRPPDRGVYETVLVLDPEKFEAVSQELGHQAAVRWHERHLEGLRDEARTDRAREAADNGRHRSDDPVLVRTGQPIRSSRGGSDPVSTRTGQIAHGGPVRRSGEELKDLKKGFEEPAAGAALPSPSESDNSPSGRTQEQAETYREGVAALRSMIAAGPKAMQPEHLEGQRREELGRQAQELGEMGARFPR